MIHIKIQSEDNAEMILKLIGELKTAMEEELQQLKKENEDRRQKKVLFVAADDQVEVLDETGETEKHECRLCYSCVHCDLNHPAPGEFPRCIRDDHKVCNSMYANFCDYYEEKE